MPDDNILDTQINTPPDSPFRDRMAEILVIISFVILGILIIGALFLIITLCRDSCKDSFDHIKDLINIILPLLGTWIGTVIAFYFGSKNFDAASKSMQTMVKQVANTSNQLQGLTVMDAMVKTDNFQLIKVKDDDELKKQKLSDLLAVMEKSSSSRLPILQDGTMKFLFLIYRETINSFISGLSLNTIKLKEGSTLQIGELTINDMFESDYKLMKDLLAINSKDFFLPITATLDQVKTKMDDNSICQDVFITNTGNADEAVLGWITNDMVIEKADLFKKAGTKR